MIGQAWPMQARAKPDPLDAGRRLARSRRWSEALPEFERALRDRGETPDVLAALGDAALALGLHLRAADLFARARVARQDDVTLSIRLARAQAAGGAPGTAIQTLRAAIAAAPENASLWLALGNLLRETGDLANAETFLREAVRLKPRGAEALGSLAEVLSDQGRHEAALPLYDAAVAAAPANAQGRLNRALSRLARGDAGGWSDYEWRLRIPEREIVRAHRLPRWDGRPRRGRRLLVMAEQGLGDQLLFAACVPAAMAGGPVLIECEPRLVPLFARAFAGAGVAPMDLEVWGDVRRMRYDWLAAAGGAQLAIEIGSLPRWLPPPPPGPEAPAPYLRPDPQETARWHAWRTALGPGPVYGVSWRSGRAGQLRAQEYAPPSDWAAFLCTLPGEIVSVQYGAAEEEIAALSAACGRAIHVPPGLDVKHEIDRLAGLLCALDGLISAPVATAVLAGALGVPTWKLLHHRSWTALGETREPFTPAVRCLTPDRPGDWVQVFAKARAAIRPGG